uniref:Uncharacterized protein n=1 Tax=Oryza barthii TaxID=65489 RepID=A0A0D3GPS4_9ORYZ
MEERRTDALNTYCNSFGRSSAAVGIMAACSQWGGGWYQQGSGRAGVEAVDGRLGRASALSVVSCQSSRAGVKDDDIPDVGQLCMFGIGFADASHWLCRGRQWRSVSSLRVEGRRRLAEERSEVSGGSGRASGWVA